MTNASIVTVDIGKNKDWSISDYLEDQQVTIEGDSYLDAITGEYYNYDKKTQKQNKSRYVGPQIGMNPIALWGLPDLEY